jgi:3D (Asp-Asp-Asp) domain-containing protein
MTHTLPTSAWGRRRGPLHYPRPPRRPQARRVDPGNRRRDRASSGSATKLFALAALALVALTSVTAARAAGTRPSGPAASPPPTSAAQPLAEEASAVLDDEVAWTVPPSNWAPALGRAARSSEPDWTVPPSNWAPAAGRAALAMTTAAAPAPAARVASASAPPVAPAPTAPVASKAQTRRLLAELTAYSASDDEGTALGVTRSGMRARSGTVAVDPAVIPLGSRLYIAGLPGVYRAEDTGGGIRGAHLDVFMDSQAAALQFGRRSNVLVEIVN